jgi:hypothetical protein
VQVTRADAAFVEAVKARTAKFEQEWLADAKAKGIDGPKVLAEYRAELKKLEAAK